MAPRSQTFYAVRHGERLDHVVKDWVADPATIVPEPPLSDYGRSQAVLTGSYLLTTLGPAHRVIIYTSPFKRCVETALGIAQGLSGIDTNDKHMEGPAVNTWVPPSPPKEKTLGSLPILRLEPGLGEWLTSSWFDDIPTPQRMCSWRTEELARKARELRGYCSVDWSYKPVCDQWVFPEQIEEMEGRLKYTEEGIERAIQKEEGDLVVIFVTHGAGVNSLLLAFKGKHEVLETGYCCLSRARWVENEVGGHEGYLGGQMNQAKYKWVVDMEASMAHLESMKQ